jgi:hypothetical protein
MLSDRGPCRCCDAVVDNFRGKDAPGSDASNSAPAQRLRRISMPAATHTLRGSP